LQNSSMKERACFQASRRDGNIAILVVTTFTGSSLRDLAL
jgi:hypothetical protein